MGQQGGTCWNLIQGNNPEFFGGANNAWNWSFCPYKDLFQECPPRPHHPRVWGFLLPADCDCAGEGNDQLRRSKSQLGGNAEEWQMRAAKSAPLH